MIDSVTSAVLAGYRADAAPLWVDAVGATAGGLGMAAQWPQVWRLWRGRQHAGLSTLSCVLNFLTPFCWTAYGVAQASGVQIVTNGIAAIGAAAVLAGLVVLGGLRPSAWLPSLSLGLATVAASALIGGAAGLGLLASVVTLSMALPQVVLLIRGRLSGRLDARGVSAPRWVLSGLCNVAWLGYGVLVVDPNIGITAGTMVVSCTAVVVLCREWRPGAAAVGVPLGDGAWPAEGVQLAEVIPLVAEGGGVAEPEGEAGHAAGVRDRERHDDGTGGAPGGRIACSP